MDRIYDLPYTRRAHPSYKQPIPAYEMIKDSVTLMRGCFGGCTFCSITAHQGRIIQSRSQESVLKEVRKMAADPEFSGIVSDIAARPPICMKCAARAPKWNPLQTIVVHPSDDLQLLAPTTARSCN